MPSQRESGATAKYAAIAAAVLSAAKERDYAGYGKFDALNSPVLSALSCGSKWLRLGLTQLVKE